MGLQQRADRGAPFAREAVELAEATGDRALRADALDAQLATNWGPHQLSERLRITARLEDVAAHLLDERTRLDAHLWRLTATFETLDVIGVRRQLLALDELGEESGSPLVRYFALTRRTTYATLTDDLGSARSLVGAAYALGSDIGVTDAYAVYQEQRAEIARHAGDTATLAEVAALAEVYGLSHGVQSIVAVASVLPGGNVWAVGPSEAPHLVADMRGLHYLRALVQRLTVEVTALDLIALVGRHGAVAESDVGGSLDREALAAYRERPG